MKIKSLNYQVIFLIIFFCLFFGLIRNSKAAEYWISPAGSDSNDGLSEESPWATFIYAENILNAGDKLILMDGTYNQQLRPRKSGTEGSPITYQAQNRGRAIIHNPIPGYSLALISNSSAAPEGAFYCHDIIIDGLIVRGNGEYEAIAVASWDSAIEEEMVKRIVIKNTGAFGSANLNNVVVWGVGNNAIDILLEDIFAYGFGRKALQVFGSKRVTIRRAVLRYDYWDGSGYKINDPRPTFSGYNTADSVFENIIVIDSAPDPDGRSSDKAAFVASGNETPAYITHSSNNKYLGLLALNYVGNGVEINGGSGSIPNDNISFKDLILWKISGAGFNIHDNDNGSVVEYTTIGYSAGTGFRVNPYPSSTYGINNEVIRNIFSTHNTLYGYYYDPTMVATFQNNTATFNGEGGTIEGSYAPTINHITQPTMVAGHERGGTMVNRYVDGVLTVATLWPWPNEELIKQHMCNPDDLIATHRIAANGVGWEPEWCASDKTLTEHIWEYLGNECPSEICNYVPDFISPSSPTGLGVI